ncbi:MAG: hypothetical protein LBR60_08875 [Fibrobacter sp.]|jgi:hypothetical protein|nr:hypothetical protein [Fibrobacter sp.]
MKKLFYFTAIAALLLTACGPSKLQIQEMSLDCDVMIEVRYVEEDTIAYLVGNTLYLTSQQLAHDSLFPLLISPRNPMDIDAPARTDRIPSADVLTGYLSRAVPEMTRFGLVIGSSTGSDFDFNEKNVVQKISDYVKLHQGASLIIFHEKDGDLIDAKKAF